MLLFITSQPLSWPFSQCFNTSHVTLYRQFLPKKFRILCVSIHLMLLFIDIYPNQSNNKDFSFNTSHVTLYPTWADIEVALATFQYISCYSLSVEAQSPSGALTYVSIHLMLLFINRERVEI